MFDGYEGRSLPVRGGVREAAKKVAKTFDLKDDWINDAVKGAMKAMAARLEGTDRRTFQILLRLPTLSKAEQVFEIIERYYPQNRIAPKTQFFIEELFDE